MLKRPGIAWPEPPRIGITGHVVKRLHIDFNIRSHPCGGLGSPAGDFCSVTLWRCDQLLRLSSAPGLFRALGLFGDEAVDGVGGAYEDSVVT